MNQIADHNRWMQAALSLALTASNMDEVPVGAIVVRNNQIIGTGYNLREKDQNPLAHAELIAIRKAAQHLNSWRLIDCSLYITLEPCLMCAGAIYQARISEVIIAASDPKAGATGSLYHIHQDQRLNHQFGLTEGIMADKSSSLLKQFFRTKRSKTKT